MSESPVLQGHAVLDLERFVFFSDAKMAIDIRLPEAVHMAGNGLAPWSEPH